MELFRGRPKNIAGRLPREIKTYDFLDSLGIEYSRTDHEPANTMEACNEIDAVLGVVICKNLFLCNRQKTKYFLLMMPGDKKFKTKELSKQINSARLSFAGPDAMLEYLDIEPGAVSIIGLMNDRDGAVQLLIDECGGLPEDTGKIIGGGPMMGKALLSLEVPMTKGSSGLLLMNEKEARRSEPQPCIRCAKCVGACPMGLEPFLLSKVSAMEEWEIAEKNDIVSCIECGSCQFTCPSNRPLLDMIRVGKTTVMGIIRSRTSKS